MSSNRMRFLKWICKNVWIRIVQMWKFLQIIGLNAATSGNAASLVPASSSSSSGTKITNLRERLKRKMQILLNKQCKEFLFFILNKNCNILHEFRFYFYF